MNSIVGGYSVDEVENAICRIHGIKAARIVANKSQEIEEIHVLATSSKGPKQLTRDIESTLMAVYGISVNHRKVSIAQIDDEEITFNKARPRLVSVKHEVLGNRAKVTIVLKHNNIEYEGVDEGPASKIGRIRLVALATLNAVEKMVPDNYTFSLEDITAINLGKDMTVIALIAILGIEGYETYAGCALVREDEREAIVRAVLDAVNRRLGFLITA
jgi:hypothetical protein